MLKKKPETIALIGNPNVGKSTIFNKITGGKQHTGNWPGKTVDSALGRYIYNDTNYNIVDLPGTYSLYTHSKEEEVTRDYLLFENPSVVLVICDATCLERNMNLVLQTIEISEKVIVCVNLMDEARSKKIEIDINLLSQELSVPVIGISAKNSKDYKRLLEMIDNVAKSQINYPRIFKYTPQIEEALTQINTVVSKKYNFLKGKRWISIKILEDNSFILNRINEKYQIDLINDDEINLSLKKAQKILTKNDIDQSVLGDTIISCLIFHAESVCADAVNFKDSNCHDRDRKIDKILTGKFTAFPVMLLLLGLIFWITVTGANYPSAILSDFLFSLEKYLVDFFELLKFPKFLYEMLVYGMYRVLAWVVSVMLPPMAIFFPLFTILEDIGYLPRVAFNLDKCFKSSGTCGKQALTMCMGLGCNAAGVTGCRIIDSKRERLIAILTNSFMPCNGRIPTLIAISTMFIVLGDVLSSSVSTLTLVLLIVLSVFITLAISKFLSKTLLKGVASSFTLELPPYRKPQFLKVIVHSIFDRTIYVLARAVSVAAPAGVIIWLLANISIGNVSLLHHCTEFLDPFAHLFGLDGVILMAFILGLPANEIVIPLIVMTYSANGILSQSSDIMQMKDLFLANGWTFRTAICVMIFMLIHWPCSTTLLTIKKETGSIKWMLSAFLIPTIIGLILCFVFFQISSLFI